MASPPYPPPGHINTTDVGLVLLGRKTYNLGTETLLGKPLELNTSGEVIPLELGAPLFHSKISTGCDITHPGNNNIRNRRFFFIFISLLTKMFHANLGNYYFMITDSIFTPLDLLIKYVITSHTNR